MFGFVFKRVPESLLVPIELKSRSPNKQRQSRPGLQPEHETHAKRVSCGRENTPLQEKEHVTLFVTNDNCQSVVESEEASVNEAETVKTLSPKSVSSEGLPIANFIPLKDETSLNVKECSCPTEVLSASVRTEHCTMSQEPSIKDGPPEPHSSESGTPTSSISDAIEIATEEQDLVAEEEDTQERATRDYKTIHEQEETSLPDHSQGDNQVGVEALNFSLNLGAVAHDIEPPETSQQKEIVYNLDDTQQQVPEGSGSTTEQENADSLHVKPREFPSHQMFIDTRQRNDKEITTQEASNEHDDSPKQENKTEANPNVTTNIDIDKQTILVQEAKTESTSKDAISHAQLSPSVHTDSLSSSSEVQQQKLNKDERRKAQLHQSQQLTRYLSKSPSKQDEEELIQLANDLKAHAEQVYEEPPSQDEIKEFAAYLGMDVDLDERWFFIAEWAMTAPLPVPWTVHLDSSGDEYFHNPETKTSQYEHPMDEKYKELYIKVKNHNPDSN